VAEFLATEAASALALLAATGAALVWANAGSGYAEFWSHDITLGAGEVTKSLSRTEWVNEGPMTIFFFVVGLEIKRELVAGDLRDRRHAAFPAIAALGGMIVPVALYIAINPGEGGWGIPMATDIAFALGVFAIAARGAPRRLRLFLLTLAVVDDVGAIVVIAAISAHEIDVLALLAACALVLLMVFMRRALGVHAISAYVLPGLAFWGFVLASGVHATLAGVVLGLLTPARAPAGAPSPAARLEHRLHPLSSWLIVPLFALANAGVSLTGPALDRAASSRIAWGILVGLVVGKTIGITAGAAVATRLGARAGSITTYDVLGVAALGGIGFTVALFTATLSFSGADLATAKVGVLAASVVAAVVGAALLRTRGRRTATSMVSALPEKGA
jgi:NhaA family Na+:H+ antiporter